MRAILNFLVLTLSSLALCACNYTLEGTAQPLPFKTIAVKQVVNNSLIVFAMILIVGVIIWVADLGLRNGLQMVIELF